MPTKSEATRRISRALEELPQLMDLNSIAPHFIEWRRNTRVAIVNTFGDNSQNLKEFVSIPFTARAASYINPSRSEALAEEAYCSGLSEAGALLKSMLGEIEEYWEDDNSSQLASPTQMMPEQQVSNRVFVVHGRDDGAKNTVARFLESFDLEAVILHEQPNAGRTIVEKFEDYADVGFAVVLCTPDDIGGLAGDPDSWRPRPRQNVILELGFFLGELGRGKVCPLVKGDLEMPSDYDGVLYVQMEGSEDWRTKLAIELKSAGLPVDLNRLARS